MSIIARETKIVKVHEFKCNGKLYVGDACYVDHDTTETTLEEKELAKVLNVKPGTYEVYQCLDVKTIEQSDKYSIEYLKRLLDYYKKYDEATDKDLPRPELPPETMIVKTVSRPFWTGVCLKGTKINFDHHESIAILPVDAGIMFFADWEDWLKHYRSYDNETITNFRNENGWYDNNVCGDDDVMIMDDKQSGKKFPYGFLSDTYIGDGCYKLISDKQSFAVVEFENIDNPESH